jgi:2-polyprenyl-6-hydroxyphenyl methylase / 3-demethylubiquinone-9 3-methyltransferase
LEKVNNDIYETYGERWYTADDDPIALLRAESKTKSAWILNKIKTHFELSKNTKVLDVGCGAGFLSNELAKHNLDVTGVDLSPESIKVAGLYDQTKSVRYLAADAYHLPFADQSFDVLTAMDFLEHVEDPAGVIKEFSRVLKPGGIFVYHTFNRNFLSYIVIIKLVEWLVKNTPKHMHVLRLFIKPAELKTYCAHAGLVEQDVIGIKPVFSSVPFKNLFTGIVPKSLKFELTSNLLLSYIGYAQKKRSL